MAIYTYDIDGWYSGNNQQDEAAGRATTIDPQVTEGGAGMRWTGSSWAAFVSPQPSVYELRAAEYTRILDPLYHKKIRLQDEGKDTAQTDAEIVAAKAEIDAKYPV